MWGAVFLEGSSGKASQRGRHWGMAGGGEGRGNSEDRSPEAHLRALRKRRRSPWVDLGWWEWGEQDGRGLIRPTGDSGFSSGKDGEQLKSCDHRRCISYLLLHNKLSQMQCLGGHWTSVLSHSFCGSGIWEHLGWGSHSESPPKLHGDAGHGSRHLKMWMGWRCHLWGGLLMGQARWPSLLGGRPQFPFTGLIRGLHE